MCYLAEKTPASGCLAAASRFAEIIFVTDTAPPMDANAVSVDLEYG
jgi:hypothetical protein